MENLVKHDGQRGGVRVYATAADRCRACKAFIRGGWFNHFVYFRDTAGEFALQYGRAAWARPGQAYVNR